MVAPQHADAARTPAQPPALSPAEIGEILVGEIGDMEPGERLPTEFDLADRFRVNRSVIRRVLDDLEARFLIYRIHGSGTYVSKRHDVIITGENPPSLHAVAATSGSEVRTVLVDSEILPLPPREAEILNAEAGLPALRMCRLVYMDDQPTTLTFEWMAPGIAENIDAALGVIESVSECLQAFGHTPVRHRTTATVADFPDEVRARLTTSNSVVGWKIETLTRDSGSDQLLMCSTAWSRLDRVRIIFEYTC